MKSRCRACRALSLTIELQVQICKEECTDPTDVCAGKHGVIYFVAATQELVDPTEAGCTISCEPQEQECSSDCVFEEVRTHT